MAGEAVYTLEFWLWLLAILMAVVVVVFFAYYWLVRWRSKLSVERFDETEGDIIPLDDYRKKAVSKGPLNPAA